jgi:hypothetical protein
MAKVLLPAGQEIFLHSTASRLSLGPKQSPVQWVQGVKQLGCENEHSPPSSAEVNNGGAISPLPRVFSWYSAELIEHSNNFTFYSLIIPQYSFQILQLLLLDLKQLPGIS